MKPDPFPGSITSKRFQLRRRLGEGGMGVVYEAYDLVQQCSVALKTLQNLNASALYRFKEEFRSLAEIVHPRLLPLYELISDGNQWFFTMELIEGGVDLLAYLRRGMITLDTPDAESSETLVNAPLGARHLSEEATVALPEKRGIMTEFETVLGHEPADSMAVTCREGDRPGRPALPAVSAVSHARGVRLGFDAAGIHRVRRIFAQLVESVQVLHRAGKLHRDLKPSNVMIRKNDELVLLDFGLVVEIGKEPAPGNAVSKSGGIRVSSSSSSTTSLHLAGTVSYMSPEQAALKPLTEASDWYAVGVMLFEVLTGRLPITGKSVMEVLRLKQEMDPPHPAAGRPDIPEDLDALCADLLQRIDAIDQICRSATVHRDIRELRKLAFGALRGLLSRIGQRRLLVLCIDDLQWGDSDSSALLLDVFGPQNPPRLLLLLCYRSEYVETSPCLRALGPLDEWNNGALSVREIEVTPFSEEETRRLARELLAGTNTDNERALEWILRQSEGNVYFVYELVRHLKTGIAKATSEPAVLDEVLWRRLIRLPSDQFRLLEVVAVAGQPLRLRDIQQAAEFRTLAPEIILGLRYDHLVRTTGPSPDDAIETFHDRIRECVVARLAPNAKKQVHGRLATTLESAGHYPPEVLATQFDGAEMPEPAARYYELAADRALKALALDRAEEFYLRAKDLAPTAPKKAEISGKLVHYYTDLARFEDAYREGRQALHRFGVRLPARFIPPLFLADLLKAKLLMRGRSISELIDLPELDDARLNEAARLLAAVGKAAYQIRPELCIAVLLKLVNQSLRLGNSPHSAIGYMAFGCIFLGGVLGRYRTGHEFGRLSVEMVEKFRNDRQRAEVNFVVGYFGTSWLKPVAEAEALWHVAREAGLGSGDLFHTGCACCATVMSLFMRGAPFAEVEQKANEFLPFLERAHLREPMAVALGIRQAIRNLRGQTSDPTAFADAEFDEEEYAQRLGQFGSRHFAQFYYVAKMQTQYLWRNYEGALDLARVSAGYLKDCPGMLHSAEHFFYEALILSALFHRGGSWRRLKWSNRLRRIHRKFRRWASLCPHNFQHKERLIAAEIARIRMDVAEARQCLGQAVAAASERGYLQVAAIGCERAFHLEHDAGEDQAAEEYLKRAIENYRLLGAAAIADRLEREDAGQITEERETTESI